MRRAGTDRGLTVSEMVSPGRDRRPWLVDAALLDEIRGTDVTGRTLGELARGLGARDPALTRAAVLHLLWQGELKTDLNTPLSGRHELARSA